MNYYPHHIGDYRRDTTHLSLLEHGVYRQLLDTYYLSEQPIPKETEVVFRRLSARTEEEKKAVEIVLSEFFVLTDDGWIHGRCDEEIRAYRGKADRARDNGKLGGRPKKTKEVISRLSSKTEEKANQEPRTNNQEPVEKHSAATAAVVLPFDEGVFPEVSDRRLVKDWVKIRKAKRLPITETGLSGFVKEVKKSGLTLESALRACCENGWGGFKASWIPKTSETFNQVTDEMFDWAVHQGVPEDRVRAETEKFVLNSRAKGSEFVDWVAAWKSWMVSAASYGAARK